MNKYIIKNNDNSVLRSYVALIIIATIVSLPHILNIWFSKGLKKLPVHLENLNVVPPWKNTDKFISNWQPSFLNASAQSHSSFQSPTGEQIDLHISYYRRQDYKSKLVTSTNDSVVGQSEKWEKKSSKRQTILLNNKYFQVNQTILHPKLSSEMPNNFYLQAWQFYWVNEKFVATDIEAKIQGLLSRISGYGDDSANIVLYTLINSSAPIEENVKTSNNVLQEFIKYNVSSLINALQQTKNKN